MLDRLIIAVACAAALVPLFTNDSPSAISVPAFDDWPTHWEDRPLHRLELTERERTMTQSFPGHIARFHDGDREVVIRWVPKPTRDLHPAEHCLRALGYDVDVIAGHRDEADRPWGRLRARRNGHEMIVREAVIAVDDTASFPDVSAWYWSATFGRTTGPWWAVTIVETSVK